MSTLKPAKKAASAAPAKSPESTSTCVYREIETDLLLDPLHAARESFDEAKLQELIVSIKLLGILEPLLVHPEGDMYRVDAGHRRLVCARAIPLKKCPCMVYNVGLELGEALKHHENAFREDLNAAEEARHFARLLEASCGGDIDRLCEIVRERRDYVEERLLLIQGDERVFQALSDCAISIGVARELNKVHDPARRLMYLESAMSNGASVRMARDWRIRGNADDEITGGAPLETTYTETAQMMPAISTGMECYICQSHEDQHEMEILYVHRSCAKAAQRMADRHATAVQESEEPI